VCLQESRQPYDLEASFTNCVSEKLYRREPCHPPREEGRKKGEEEGNKEGGEGILPHFGEALEAQFQKYPN